MSKIFQILLFATLVHIGAATKADAEKRVALFIGNSNYDTLKGLPNPSVDVKKLSGLFRKHKFSVREEKNINFDRFDKLLNEFEVDAADTDVALIYFAGHGMRINAPAGNVLAPTNAEIDCMTRRGINVVTLSRLMQTVQKAKNQIIIVDACRDNPFVNCSRSTKGVAFGLGQPRGLPPQNNSRIQVQNLASLVVYSTQQNHVAFDGVAGKGSPFANALFETMSSTPTGLIDDVIDQVSAIVRQATNGVQSPSMEFPYASKPRVCLSSKECKRFFKEDDGLTWSNAAAGSYLKNVGDWTVMATAAERGSSEIVEHIEAGAIRPLIRHNDGPDVRIGRDKDGKVKAYSYRTKRKTTVFVEPGSFELKQDADQ